MKSIPIRHINVPEKEPNFSGGISIRDVRDVLAGKDMVQELHRHDFYYVLALKKGKGNHEIDFTAYEIGDHSVFVMRPGQVHQLTLKAGSTGYLLEFKNDFYYPHDKASNPLVRKATHTNHYGLDVRKFSKLFSVLTAIFEEYTARQEAYQDVIQSNLRILFIELVRLKSKIPLSNTTTYAEERLEAFVALLETYVSGHKQASYYSEALSLSPFQLSAITRAALGKTPSELITDYIILESKRLLLATSNRVNQIAYHLGYEDVSYFIRFFRKHTGSSPDAFRHNFR